MKIKLPKNPIKPEDIKSKIKRIISDDCERGGIMAKVIAFIHMDEPSSNEDIKESMQNYYKEEIDKQKIKANTKRLYELGVLKMVTSGEIITMPQNELVGLYQEAYRKFFKYLDHIPKQFRRNYDKVSYYWISNGGGLEYVEWACKLLNFEVEK